MPSMPPTAFARHARAAIPLALIALTACGAPANSVQQPLPTSQSTVPEAVIALADPRQDLTTAFLNPDDGCYWYRYQGPVETTLLPLRTPEGNMICNRQPAS